MKTFVIWTLTFHLWICLNVVTAQIVLPIEFPHLKQTRNSPTARVSALETVQKTVRFVYLVPADSVVKPQYKVAIANAALNLQSWYKEQIGSNKSFTVSDPVVQVVHSTHPAEWYYTNPETDWAGVWKFWFNEVNDAFSLTGGNFEDQDNFWVIYIDALPVCPMLQGGGLSHVAAMGANDLRGLVGKSWIPICDEVIPDYSSCRYVGGLGHELGHAFGLPHPPGCDDGQPVACDYQSLMFTGYLSYPNTYFSAQEKTLLLTSPFIGTVNTSACVIECSDLTNETTFTKSNEVSICNGTTFFAGGKEQSAPGTYVDRLQDHNGCDSIIITHLKIHPTYRLAKEISICQGDGYFAGGAQQTKSGTYSDTYKTIHGCDSVIVTKLNVRSTFKAIKEISICNGQSYFAGGSLQFLPGNYVDKYLTKWGCDSVVTTHLKVLSRFNLTKEVTICAGHTYFAAGALQATSGEYTDKYLSSGGCDSVVVTRLKVLPRLERNREVSICAGETYFTGGSFQSVAGIYHDLFKTKNGCDSIVNTTLKVLAKFETRKRVSVCNGQTYFAGGKLRTTSGEYTDKYVSIGGCDSVVVTVLEVQPRNERNQQSSICAGETYFAGGSFQSAPGLYRDVFKTKNGCDSIVNTELKVLAKSETTKHISICSGQTYFAGGHLQSKGGTFVDTFESATTCDSVVTTILTVVSNYEITIDAMICNGESYFAGGALQTMSGEYRDTFVSVSGCDSLIITHLTAGICTGVGVDIDNAVSVYPVPANNELFIQAGNSHHCELFNAMGQRIASTTENNINLEKFSEGVYCLRIYYSSNNFVSKKIILKR